MKVRHAIILAGGLGTRLRAAVSDRPKVLALVNGKPFLTYLLRQLEQYGITAVTICTGYMADLVVATIGHSFGKLSISYSEETTPLGTGGAIRKAMAYPSMPDMLPIMVLNGDSYCDADLASFWTWYAPERMAAGIILTEVNDASRYGQVDIETTGRITSFQEKGKTSGAPGLINAGIYMLSRRSLADCPEGMVSLEKDLIPQWLTLGIYGFPCNGRFIDIGTPESYRDAERFFRHMSSAT